CLSLYLSSSSLRPRRSPLFPSTTLFRSVTGFACAAGVPWTAGVAWATPLPSTPGLVWSRPSAQCQRHRHPTVRLTGQGLRPINGASAARCGPFFDGRRRFLTHWRAIDGVDRSSRQSSQPTASAVPTSEQPARAPTQKAAFRSAFPALHFLAKTSRQRGALPIRHDLIRRPTGGAKPQRPAH